jgi:putative ABC transport system permease protein
MTRPPKWPIAILRWLCKPGFVEEIEGDLTEDYYRRVETKRRTYATIMFCIESLAFIRRRLLRSDFTLIGTTMMRSYITMSWRSMVKKPLFTLINIFGLTAGLASVVVISGYILFTLGYDQQYENADRVYRVTLKWVKEESEQHTAMAFAPVATALDKTLHAVKNVVRVYPYSGLVSVDGTDKIRESRFCYADSLFFDMFPMRVLHGEPSTALTAPYSVVLTERMAIRYFGSSDIVGRELQFEDERAAYKFNVTAVIEDVAQNTHMNPDFLASMSTLDKIMPWYNSWHYPPMYVYIEAAGTDQAQLQLDIDKQIKSTHPEYIPENERTYITQLVTDIHLHSNLANEWQANSNYVYVQILMVVAALILFLACINYINLAIARGTERVREVGMRKVMGAVRRQLMTQFLGESFVTALIAMILAVGLAEIVFKFYLNDLLEKNLGVFTLFSSVHILSSLGGLVLLTVLAGIYPAFFLSRYRPVSMLRGDISKTKSGLILQRSMVTFQFVVSCLLIIGMIIIGRQTTFMREKRLGFDKDQLVAIRLFDRKMGSRYNAFKDQLMSESVVRHVAVSSAFPMKDGFHGWDITPEGHNANERMTMKSLSGDQDLIKALKLKITAGRDFSYDNAADSTKGFIINEAAARSLNWPDPIGKEFELTFYSSKHEERKGKVIGVVKDFHFESLYNSIDPLVIFVSTHPYYCDYLLVRLAPGNLASSIAVLEAEWKKFSADKPFEFFIADDDLNSMYKSEMKLSSMFSSFTALSIIVSCLGLLGLSAYTISRRLKEIGIRRILGASIGSVFLLLSKEYLLLVLLAQAVAWPLAWWFATEWLAGFAYKVDVPLDVFLITLMAGVLLGTLSICLHIFRAVRASPAETLRIE